MDRLGVTGSCTCRTSNRPADSQRRTRAAEIGPKASRATEPLYRTGTDRPAETTYGGRYASSSDGARTLTSCPSPISVSARSCTWFCTPPGTSNQYGQTSPTRMPPPLTAPVAGSRQLPPHPLEHVPVFGVSRDPGREPVRQILREHPDPLGQRTGVGRRYGQRPVEACAHGIPLIPHVYRVQRCSAAQREHGRAGRHGGRCAEEVHLDAASGQVPVGEQGDDVPLRQPLDEQVERGLLGTGERDDLHA